MPDQARLVASLVFALAVSVATASAQSLSWSSTYDGGPAIAASRALLPRGIVVDSLGNTYVAGSAGAGVAPEPTPTYGVANSGLVIKYGPSGQVFWTRQTEASVIALALDDQGGPLLVTTEATLSYGTSGNLLWKTPHLLAGRYVRPTAARPAPGGGIYVAGVTASLSTGRNNVALARLDAAGRLVWLSTWDGSPGLDDEALDLGVDAAGSIYVSGRSRKQENPTIDAYLTTAFSNSGALLWARLLAAPDYTTPAAFAVDPAGGAFAAVPLGISDWRSVKYDANGNVSWSRDFTDLLDLEYSTPDGAAVTSDGAVYVAGHSHPSRFPVLVRYEASGVQQWAKVGNTTVLGLDPLGLGLGVDAAGRAIVVRTLDSGQLRTSATDPSGATAWSRDLAWTAGSPPSAVSMVAAGIAVGPAGEVRIASTRAGSAGSAIVAASYDGAGVFLWGVEPPPVAPDEGAVAVRLDGSGNAVVLASGYADGQSLFRTLKYNPSGTLVWAQTLPGRPSALVVSSAGEAIAAGVVEAPGGSQLALVKYDAAGAPAWTRTYLPPGFTEAYGGSGVALALDAIGNVYLTGRVVSTEVRATVVKYSPDGTLLWARNGAFPIADPLAGVPRLAISPNGNVIVGSNAYPSGTFQYHVWALDPDGATAWNAFGDSTNPAGSNTGAMVVDALGNLIVGDFYSGRVDKLSPSGTRLSSFDTGGRVIALSVDPAGAIAVASGLPYAFRIARYSALGAELWSRSYESAPITLWSWSLRSGADGGLHAAGAYWDAALGFQKSAFVAAYDGTGQVRWARARAGLGGGPASFTDFDLDGTGRLVAAGYVANGPTNFDVLVQSMTDDATVPLLFNTVAPCRVFDSRDPALGGPAAVPANALFEAQVAGRCGVPSTARSVAFNVTVTGGTAAGHLTLFPAGRVPPPTSTVNHPGGITRATQAVVELGDAGRVAVRAIQGSGSVHVILDVSGYFE